MAKIVHAELVLGCGLREFLPSIRHIASQHGVELPALADLTLVAEAPPLLARVEHGRWLVDCPDCNGAGFAWDGERLFMCQSCWNAALGGKWRRVAFPAEREEIEAVLLERPHHLNRNWRPGESLVDLENENRAHGCPVPSDRLTQCPVAPGPRVDRAPWVWGPPVTGSATDCPVPPRKGR